MSLNTPAVTPALSHRKPATSENLRTVFALHFNLTFFHGKASKRYTRTSWRVQTFCAIKLPCSEHGNMGTEFSMLSRWINRSIFFSSLFLRLFNDGVFYLCMKTSVARFPPWGKKRLKLSVLFNAEGVYLFYSHVIPIDFTL